MRARTGFLVAFIAGLFLIAFWGIADRWRAGDPAATPVAHTDESRPAAEESPTVRPSTRSESKRPPALNLPAGNKTGSETNSAPAAPAIAPGESRIVQLIIAKEGRRFRVIGRQEAAGRGLKPRLRLSPRDTHLCLIYDAEGREIARSGANLSGLVYADALGPDGKTLTGGPVRLPRATAAVRYMSRGEEARLDLRVLPSARRPVGGGIDVDQLELAWTGDLR